jgi:cupredoxin-like protein
VSSACGIAAPLPQTVAIRGLCENVHRAADPDDPLRLLGAPAASPMAQAAAGSTIQLIEFAFNPKAFTIPANTPTTLTLTDAGVSVHNFNIDQLNVHSGDLEPGQSTQVTIDAPAGTY